MGSGRRDVLPEFLNHKFGSRIKWWLFYISKFLGDLLHSHENWTMWPLLIGCSAAISKLWVSGNQLGLSLRMPIPGFSGGLVIKNLPANAGDTGSIPGLGRFHMLQGD